MTATSPAVPRESLWSRLGIPDLQGDAKFVVANAIDSLGNGAILAFQVVYFVMTTKLSLTTVGAALTLAQLLAVPMPVPIGPLIDRIGARAVAIIGNSVSAVGFVGFLFAHSPWQIVCVVLVTQTGATMYWTSSSGLVVLAAKEGERTRWFGFIRALRNIGVGLGGALAALAVGIGGTSGLRSIVVLNIVSFVVAIYLMSAWRPEPAPEPAAQPAADAGPGTDAAPAPRTSYLGVLRDTAYLRLVVVNLSLVYAAMVLGVLLAAYITDGLHRGVWLAGVLIVVNTGLVATTQTLVSRKIEKYRATRSIAVCCLCNAAAFAIFAFADVSPGWAVVTSLFVAMIVYTLAENVGAPPSNELSVALAPPEVRGRYLAIYQLSWTLGGASSPWLLTVLLSHGAVLPWMFLLAMSLLAVPLVLSLERRMEATPAAQQAAEAAPVGDAAFGGPVVMGEPDAAGAVAGAVVPPEAGPMGSEDVPEVVRGVEGELSR